MPTIERPSELAWVEEIQVAARPPFIGDLREIQRIGEVIGGEWIFNRQGKGVHKILRKARLGQVD